MNQPIISCAMSELFDILGQKRNLHLIKLMENGVHKFNDFKKNFVGISSNILSQRLKTMEDFGLISKQITDRPISICYHLTEKGIRIAKILQELEKC